MSDSNGNQVLLETSSGATISRYKNLLLSAEIFLVL